MITFEDLRRSGAVATYIQKADDSLSALGFTEHSFAHGTKAAMEAGHILETIGSGSYTHLDVYKRQSWGYW